MAHFVFSGDSMWYSSRVLSPKCKTIHLQPVEELYIIELKYHKPLNIYHIKFTLTLTTVSVFERTEKTL